MAEYIKADLIDIIESEDFVAADYKGDSHNWVRYAYVADLVDIPPGVEITNDSYTKILEDGQVQTIFLVYKGFIKSKIAGMNCIMIR